MEIGFMVASILVVAGAMFGCLTWFFRRLRRIEEDVWGPQARVPFRTQLRETLYRIRHHIRKS